MEKLIQPPTGEDKTPELMTARLEHLAEKQARYREIESELYQKDLEKYELEVALGVRPQEPKKPYTPREETAVEVSEYEAKHKSRAVTLSQTIGNKTVRRSRYVDLDLGGGFDNFETKMVRNIGKVTYMLTSTRNIDRSVSRYTADRRTKLFAFTKDMEHPLSVKTEEFTDELPMFPIEKSFATSWQLVTNELEEIAAPQKSPRHREEWKYTDTHDPKVIL